MHAIVFYYDTVLLLSFQVTGRYNFSIRILHLEELYPTSETFVLLEITVPKMQSDVLNLHISTNAALGDNRSLIMKDNLYTKEMILSTVHL